MPSGIFFSKVPEGEIFTHLDPLFKLVTIEKTDQKSEPQSVPENQETVSLVAAKSNLKFQRLNIQAEKLIIADLEVDVCKEIIPYKVKEFGHSTNPIANESSQNPVPHSQVHKTKKLAPKRVHFLLNLLILQIIAQQSESEDKSVPQEIRNPQLPSSQQSKDLDQMINQDVPATRHERYPELRTNMQIELTNTKKIREPNYKDGIDENQP